MQAGDRVSMNMTSRQKQLRWKGKKNRRREIYTYMEGKILSCPSSCSVYMSHHIFGSIEIYHEDYVAYI